MNKFDNYFDLRNVSVASYAHYTIPAYLKKELPADRTARILDIGCGIGQLLDALRRSGYVNITGIDVSQEAVSQCMERGLSVEHIDDLGAFCMNGKNQYDFILMNHVIEHLPKDKIIDILGLIRTKLLATGGQFVIATPNAQSSTGCYWAYEDFTHTVIFTAGSLTYILRSAGFTRISFLDPYGTDGSGIFVKLVCRLFLRLYRWKISFWNKITRSSFHRPSPQIFTYELKVSAE